MEKTLLPAQPRPGVAIHALFTLVLMAALPACKSSSSRSETIAPPGTEAAAQTAASPEDEREHVLAALVESALEEEHLIPKKIDDEVSQKAFDRYIEQLDPGKLFMLSEQVHALREHAARMDDEIHQGRLELAHVGARIYAERVAVVEKIVAEILAAPLDFTDEEWLETDADKLDYCATDSDLRERWRKSLEYQILLRIARMEAAAEAREANPDAAPPARPVPATAEERDQKAREEVAESYAARFARLAKLDRSDHLEMYINAIASVYDPYTTYLPPPTKEDFDIHMSGSLEGIGAVLSESEHYIKVVEIVPGSASWRQGELEAEDIILAVAQGEGEPVDVIDMRLRDVVKMIRGEKGTAVTLTVRKSDQRIAIIPIIRDVVEIEAAYAQGAILKHRKAGGPVGYIYLPSFYGNTRTQPGSTPSRQSTDDVRRLLAEFGKKRIHAAILDMRSNGGGLLDDARAMSGLFIAEGPIVQTRSADGELEILRDTDDSIAFGGELVVLVDRFSASAAEILAAALQDYGRAVIVGTEQTYGKGTVQMLVNLDRMARRTASLPLGVLKLTRQQFYRITGASTQRRGVVPDIVLPDSSAHIEAGERYLDHALPWTSIEKVPYEVWSKKSWDQAALAARSKTRQEKSAMFKRVIERNKVLHERRANTREPLRKETWLSRREQEKKELEAFTAKLKDEPVLFDVKRVDYDGSLAAIKDRPRPKRGDKKASDKASAGKAAAKERGDTWAKNLARDAWIEEALYILSDMNAN